MLNSGLENRVENECIGDENAWIGRKEQGINTSISIRIIVGIVFEWFQLQKKRLLDIMYYDEKCGGSKKW